MSIAKTIEISAESPESFTDAIQRGIDRANDTVENIKAAWVNEQQVTVEGGAVKSYRVNMKVTFLLK